DFPIVPPPQSAGEPDWSQVQDTLTSDGGRYLALVIPRVPPGGVARRILLAVPAADQTFQLHVALTPPWADGSTFRTCLADGGAIQNPTCMGSQLSAINAYLAGASGFAAVNGIGLWAKVGWQCEGATTLTSAVANARQTLGFMLQRVEETGT